MELNKKIYIGAAVAGVLIIAVVSFMIVRGSRQPQPVNQTRPTQIKEEIMPTVDSSVQVSVEPHLAKHTFDLIVEGIPTGTTALEYEITYQTKKGGLPGYSSSVDIEPDRDTYEKKDLLLGTCSSGGACTYDEIDGPLKVTIKFTGSYGEKLYEGEFELGS